MKKTSFCFSFPAIVNRFRFFIADAVHIGKKAALAAGQQVLRSKITNCQQGKEEKKRRLHRVLFSQPRGAGLHFYSYMRPYQQNDAAGPDAGHGHKVCIDECRRRF